MIQENDKILIKYEQNNIYFIVRSANYSKLCLLCKRQIAKGDLYGGNRYKVYCLKCCQKNLIRNEGSPEQKPRKIIKCRQCKQKGEHYAFGLCGKCYSKYYKKKYPERVKALRIKRKEADQKYHKEYYQKNKEKFKAYDIKHREKIRQLADIDYLNKLRNHYKKTNNTRRYDGNKPVVLLRDNYQCQICGAKERLVIHHIDGRNYRKSTRLKANNNPENLLTLCNYCHRSLHGFINIQKFINTKGLKIKKFTTEIRA